jgi:hypothetical protein
MNDIKIVVSDTGTIRVVSDLLPASGAVASAAMAAVSATAAAASKLAAALSAQSAAVSEADAAVSAFNALTSQETASGSEAAVLANKLASAVSETAALISKIAAAASETNALASKNAAALSSTNAATAATAAHVSELVAGTSAAAASASEINALASKVAAAASQVAALASQAGAAGSATVASTQATNASTSATNAGASATSAGNSVAQATAIKTQTETARDAAIAGLGAADQSINLVLLSAGVSAALDIAGKAEGMRASVVQSATLVATTAATAAATATAETALEGTVSLLLNVTQSELLLAALQVALDLAGIACKQVGGGNVQLAAGTVTEPSLWAASDRNSGIFFPAADVVAVVTGGLERLRVDANGRWGLGTNAPSGLLDVNDNKARVRTAQTPASATATGNPGEFCWDAGYWYVCTAANVWKRSALATW